MVCFELFMVKLAMKMKLNAPNLAWAKRQFKHGHFRDYSVFTNLHYWIYADSFKLLSCWSQLLLFSLTRLWLLITTQLLLLWLVISFWVMITIIGLMQIMLWFFFAQMFAKDCKVILTKFQTEILWIGID